LPMFSIGCVWDQALLAEDDNFRLLTLERVKIRDVESFRWP